MSANVPYDDFLRSKDFSQQACGFGPGELHPALKPFQRDITRWALRKGRAALFEDCGLGKTLQSLEWSRCVAEHTGGKVLILAPLAVAQQTVGEGEKWGIGCEYRRDMPSGEHAITITNYEMLEHFNPADFAGVVLDECLAAGTPVDTPGGPRYIQDIRAGDEILNASGVDRVSDVHRREVPYAIRVWIGKDGYISSPNHPFFTQRGWIAAQDLVPDDYALATDTAMRMVRYRVLPEIHWTIRPEILRDILLSEMADATAGYRCQSSFARSQSEEGTGYIKMVAVGVSGGRGSNRENSESNPVTRSRSGGEDFPPIAGDRAQTFRAWWQRDRVDISAADLAGTSRTDMDSGVSLLVGESDSWLSNLLQAGLGSSRSENKYRGGWVFARAPKESGSEEGRKDGFIRVDGIEVLQQGSPELDPLRSEDGKLYFYDLGGTRHPSFSVGGFLVHNSSILKAYDGKTRTRIIEAFGRTPYRLACTATPAPNDHMELGNHSEFLGVMRRSEMLSMFFVHDGGETQKWRIKGHAEGLFWRWVASWAVMIRKPSDLGYSDEGYELPPLRTHVEIVNVPEAPSAETGTLFPMPAVTLSERRDARRASIGERVSKVAAMVNQSTEPWVLWCNLNAEGDALEEAIPDSVQVAGSDDLETKSARLTGFSVGEHRVMVSKSRIAGFGMNWQHCSKQAFVGLSDSYEAFYQAIRRSWRFGQTKLVDVYVVIAETEQAVLANIHRKEQEADEMAKRMVENMAEVMREEIAGTTRTVSDYSRESTGGEGWRMELGDSVEVLKGEPDNSVDFSIYSPPFASLYTYSNSDRDMGNAKDHAEFFQHFGYLIPELLRVTKPGRLMSVHCMNLPTSKVRDGVIGITDFRGQLIRAFTEAGWIYHSEVTIWKDPVTAMQRTKAKGLLWKQLRKDSTASRMGIPDYVETFRKPGDNSEPVSHTEAEFPVDVWQRYASPVWFDINPSETLQRTSAREEKDERHIAPLQLEVIRRCVELWSNPGDTVLSPFAGIGSEGYEAIKNGRRFLGIELKRSYYVQACANLLRAVSESKSGTLLELMKREPETPTDSIPEPEAESEPAEA